MLETKRVPLTLPGKRVDGMKLDNNEYHALVSLSRRELELGGRDFKGALTEIMNSSLYQDATPDTKITLIKDIQQTYDRAAKTQMYTEDADYRERLDRYRAKRAAQKVGGEQLPERLQDLIE